MAATPWAARSTRISKRPSQEFGGEIRAGYGNYDRYRDRGRRLAARWPTTCASRSAAAQDHQRDGFIENIGGGQRGRARSSAPTSKVQVRGRARPRSCRSARATTARAGTTPWAWATAWSNLITPYDTTRAFGLIGAPGAQPAVRHTRPPTRGVDRPLRPEHQHATATASCAATTCSTTTVSLRPGLRRDLKYIGGFQQYNYQTGGDNDGTSRTSRDHRAGHGGSGTSRPRPPTSTSTSGTTRTRCNLTPRTATARCRWILGVYQYHEEYRQRIQLGNPKQSQLANPLLSTRGAPAWPRAWPR